ncbi:prolipoprotein diacylglyceryl transferase [Calothrix sp. FACHB-1219]|uniref:prolipoprotein diacylglyceryl transferase n=1 Tax=unclassified Calothrix TaxID=2619626 RepID=UPI001686A68C|nr:MULTISPECIES: prolipoprotein diacylglyceryl transferase family protein [unclassified Calothrix]MBD2204798.1 prolipoprotein diacylglyceryl transferase [Calothrix sp. FACHB-168]MBD2218054.1 prolipoprotein diacylglyceryl transferase [Calothrix sp. FACHB-1219]
MTFPVYIGIGSLRIHPHILFESLAYATAFRLLIRRVRKDSITPSQRTSVIVGGLIGALIGAKMLVWLQHIDLIWQNQQQLLLLLLQGKTVVGALLGGLIGVEITKKILGIHQSTGDVFVFPLIVGTGIGRIGCFLTGLSDRTYGIATTLPWGVDFGDGVPRHPTQLYEILFLLLLIIFLSWRSRFQYENGELFKFYLISYFGFRFLIDFIKPDFHPFLGLSAIQITCLLTILYYHRSISQMFQFNK